MKNKNGIRDTILVKLIHFDIPLSLSQPTILYLFVHRVYSSSKLFGSVWSLYIDLFFFFLILDDKFTEF